MTQRLEDFADETAQARFVENQEIARRNRTLSAQLRERDEELAAVRRRLGIYEALDSATLAPPKWLAPPKRKNDHHKAIPSMLLTDIHYGERVRPEEIGGVNCYDTTIAEQRIRRACEGAVKVCRDYLSGLEYEGLNLMLGGDMVSGDIHDELRETNAATLADSVVGVLECIVAGARILADHFGQVHIGTVVGNHGRATKKPRAKGRARDSFDGLVYQLVARELRDDKRFNIQVATGPDLHFSVYDTRYCLTHGDQFRGGSGIAAELSPLLLGLHRKTRRDQSTKNPWDVMVMGHFHKRIPLRGLIVGGAIVGYNEYAYQQNYSFEEPSSELWLNTPERGVSAHYPIYPMDRKAEGW
jgi:predicted phosphodiesterase